MKKRNLLLLALFVCACACFALQYAYSADFGVTANIPSGTPEITVSLRELTTAGQNPTDGTEVDTMTFGQLTHTLTGGGEAGVWYSTKYYCAIIYTSSWGHQYEIRSSCDGLSNGTNALPAGAFMLTPNYVGADRWTGNDPLTAQDTDNTPPGTLGSVTRGITGTGNYAVVYRSELAASNRILRAFYSIPGYTAGGNAPYADWQPLELSQTGGNYQGTVYITIAAI
jgi:hypothetical protein